MKQGESDPWLRSLWFGPILRKHSRHQQGNWGKKKAYLLPAVNEKKKKPLIDSSQKRKRGPTVFVSWSFVVNIPGKKTKPPACTGGKEGYPLKGKMKERKKNAVGLPRIAQVSGAISIRPTSAQLTLELSAIDRKKGKT